jgi:hypothetical protein
MSLTSKTRRNILLALALTSAFTLATRAQTPTPIPSQFATAHTVFLASGSTAATGNPEEYASALYPSTYRMLSSLNYQMVASPAAADLGMEISVVISPSITVGFPGSAYLQLVVRDIKTQALLWTIQVPISQDFRAKSIQNNLDPVEARIAADLKSLISGTLPTSTKSTGKTRITQENH